MRNGGQKSIFWGQNGQKTNLIKTFRKMLRYANTNYLSVCAGNRHLMLFLLEYDIFDN